MTHGWKLFEYIEDKKLVFKNRDRDWMMMQPFGEQSQSLNLVLQSLDHMGMGNQYFFVSALHCSGIMMTVFGQLLIMHVGYNLFSDPLMIPTALTMRFAGVGVKKFTLWFRVKRHVWTTAG